MIKQQILLPGIALMKYEISIFRRPKPKPIKLPFY